MIFLFSSHSLLLSTVSQKKVQSDLFRVVVLLILSIDLFLSLFNRKLRVKVRLLRGKAEKPRRAASWV